MWKLNLGKGKERWLILLAIGCILLILSFPTKEKKPSMPEMAAVQTASASGSQSGSDYEEELERRVKKVLRNVEGVGEVDVMIVLKSSEEKIYRVDKTSSTSLVDEKDTEGGTRNSKTQELSEDTVLSGGSQSGGPLLEKEIRPEISGIVISADGGGSAAVKAEISEAMEALFNVPPHKIKVLKRVD